MQLPDESNSKRQISNEKHIAYRIGLQEISQVIQDYPALTWGLSKLESSDLQILPALFIST